MTALEPRTLQCIPALAPPIKIDISAIPQYRERA